MARAANQTSGSSTFVMVDWETGRKATLEISLARGARYVRDIVLRPVGTLGAP